MYLLLVSTFELDSMLFQISLLAFTGKLVSGMSAFANCIEAAKAALISEEAGTASLSVLSEILTSYALETTVACVF